MKKFLNTTNPELIEEWDYEKNFPLKPENCTRGQIKKVNWICRICYHPWPARISDRAIKKSGCPKKAKNVSQQEIRVYCELKTIFFDLIQQYELKSFKLDMFIPSLNTAIEIDGFYAHKNKYDRDIKRHMSIINTGISVFHIRQKGLLKIDSSDVFYKQITFGIIKDVLLLFKNFKLDSDVKNRIDNYLNLDQFVNEDLYRELCNRWHRVPFEKSLASLNLSQIPIDENGNSYDTRNIYKYAHLEFNWKCKICNKTWENRVADQVKSGACQYCNNRKVTDTYNLKVLFPDLMSEWSDLNKALPESFYPFSGQEAWWDCKVCKKPYYVPISRRTSKNTGCTFCNSKKTNETNNLAVKHPKLLTQWDYSKNSVSPYEVLPNPKLASEWHSSNRLTAKNVTFGQKMSVNWQCTNCNKIFPATILNRSQRGSGCKICGFRIAPEFKNTSAYFHIKNPENP